MFPKTHPPPLTARPDGYFILTMNKKYKLLRELPDAKVGTIFTEDGKGYYDYNSSDGSQSFYSSNEMENNPGWFEKVVEDFGIEMPSGAMQFFKAAGEYWRDGEGEYYRLPFWYKFIKNNVAVAYTLEQFENLSSRKEWLSMCNPPKDLTKEQTGELIKEMHNQPIQFLKAEKEFTKENLQEAFNKSRLTHPNLGFVYKDFTEYYDLLPLITKAYKKEYKILTWRIFNGELHTKETVAPCNIHALLRVSDNTTWTVGDETVRGGIIKMEIDGEEILVTFRNKANKYLKDI